MDKLYTFILSTWSMKQIRYGLALIIFTIFGAFLWISLNMWDLATWFANFIEAILGVPTGPTHVRGLFAVCSLFLFCLFLMLTRILSSKRERFKLMTSTLEELVALNVSARKHTLEGDCISTAKFFTSTAELAFQLNRWKICTPPLIVDNRGDLFHNSYIQWKLYCAKLIRFSSAGDLKGARSWASTEAMDELIENDCLTDTTESDQIDP